MLLNICIHLQRQQTAHIAVIQLLGVRRVGSLLVQVQRSKALLPSILRL